MAIKRYLPEGYIQVNIQLREDLDRLVEALAKKHQLTKREAVNHILDKYFSEHPIKPGKPKPLP